jgi:methionyl-tRNA synthetase
MKTDSRVQATSAAGNKFLQEHAPWELMKKKKAG